MHEQKSNTNLDGILVVIPARMKSSRFPGKPLAKIAGEHMIIRTAKRVLAAVPNSHVVIATDNEEIKEVCQSYGLTVCMTQNDKQTGSDRVAEVAETHLADFYINVQGDEPLFNPRDIELIVEAYRNDPDNIEVFTGYCDLEPYQWSDSKFIKMLFSRTKRLIYIGRAQVPGSHSGDFHFGYRQVCVYGYTREMLNKFASTDGRLPIEEVEDHEIQRFLELDIPVRAVKLSSESISVDRPGDVSVIEDLLISRGLS